MVERPAARALSSCKCCARLARGLRLLRSRQQQLLTGKSAKGESMESDVSAYGVNELTKHVRLREVTT